MNTMRMMGVLGCLAVGVAGVAHAQYLDEFRGKELDGWFFFTGDGNAVMDFVPKDGVARISVDARRDPHNVWWSIVKRDVSDSLDLTKLADPAFELRVEARVRTSSAPRRINFMINTHRTTDFHEHLAEYDIAESGQWHTISLTTRNLDAIPGDSLFVQLGVTDWGHETYEVDLDYYRADIVRVDEAGPDLGEPLTYHPPIPQSDSFSQHLLVSRNALINLDFPDVNFGNWKLHGPSGAVDVLTVDARQWALLAWDFSKFKGSQVSGAGVFEFTPHSIAHGGRYIEHYGEDLGVEFGRFRVIEVLGGPSDWDPAAVTWNQIVDGKTYEEVFNGQMLYDVALEPDADGRIRITVSRPAMQRLIDGRTRGLLIRPLGAVSATLLPLEAGTATAPVLHFNFE